MVCVYRFIYICGVLIDLSSFGNLIGLINTKFNHHLLWFESPFDRKVVTSEDYFTRLIWYIHSNAEKHGFVKDFREYPYSSYHSHLLHCKLSFLILLSR